MSEYLRQSLLSLLGVDALVRLAERFGGRRLLVPPTIDAEHPIAVAIGPEAAAKLIRRYSPAVIRVPLVRDIRARYYRAGGLSNGEIATRLGVTETAVDKIFRRMDAPPIKGSGQLDLFHAKIGSRSTGNG